MEAQERKTSQSTNQSPNLQTKKDQKPEDPNVLEFRWIAIHLVKDQEKSYMNVKLERYKDYLNPKILIKTNDYKLEDGFVTVRVQPTLDGLKKLNGVVYRSVEKITKRNPITFFL